MQLGPSILEDLGLRAGLEWLAARVRAETGIDIVLDIECEERRITPPLAIALFRVAQEALTNIVRHAHATSAIVQLREAEGTIDLSIADDGRGFDVEAARTRPAASVGLFGMAERVALVEGSMSLRSSATAGTRIEVRIPLPEEVAP